MKFQANKIHGSSVHLFARFILFLFLVFHSDWVRSQMSPADQKKIDSLESSILSATNDTDVVNGYFLIDRMIYRYDMNLDLELNEKIDSICSAHLTGNISKSEEIQFYVKKLAYAENSKGIIHKNLGNFSVALKEYYRAERAYSFVGDKRNLAGVKSNFGVIYMRKAENQRAKEYFSEALAEFEAINDTNGIALAYQNLALCDKEDSNYAGARENSLKAIKYFKLKKNKNGISQVYNNLSTISLLQGDYKMSELYSDSSILIKKETGDLISLAASLANRSELFLTLEDYESAEQLSLEALRIAKQFDNKEILADATENLYKIYETKGQFQQALEMFRQYQAANDYVNSVQQTREMSNLEFMHKYQSKTMADSIRNAQLEREKKTLIEKSEITRRNQQLKQWLLVGGGLAATLVAFLMFNRFRTSQRQKRIIEEQKEVVEVKNREILASINYAKRLQDAILPPMNLVACHLPDHFIFYQPKDIVAGDFYWIECIDDVVFIAAADCTGHGVPGAMVSVVCSNALSKAVYEENLKSTASILHRTRDLVIEKFGRSDKEVMDGMDISLCAVNRKTGKILWSGANFPLWYRKDGSTEITEIAADKQPVGKFVFKKPFHEVALNLNEVEQIYLFSDGFADQFGGPNRKKFYSGNFKKLLESIAHLPMKEQGAAISEIFNSWKGSHFQIDDVCVISFRL